jgi:catechol 2,3-dioxygenase-like lactoylglutathione lyase family enzyme
MPAPRPLFNQINIVGSNLDASLAFYRRLGVDIPEERVWRTATGPHHAAAADSPSGTTLDIDSAKFASTWNGGWKGRSDLAGRVVVGFDVVSREEVDRLYARMTTAGYRGLQPPYDAFWGSRYAVIEDPDGLAIGLMSPRSDAKRSEPPDV